MHEVGFWLDAVLPRHERLTSAVVAITENLLRAKHIDYLAVTGRTKNTQSSIDKVKRKGYKDPSVQLTDLSGIRIILYFESDVAKACQLIEEAFNVDWGNSLNKDALLSTDQIGYRSSHYVCDLGEQRAALPEFAGLSKLKFEFQVRTVLQHAWAELAHDRNYKFSGKLPREIERQLFLYAGMLEIADKGFNELSTKIDNYIKAVAEKSARGDLSTEINSVSLEQFVEEWCKTNGIRFEPHNFSKDDYREIVKELDQFGITTLAELNDIIPENYVEALKIEDQREYTLHGYVRDWMLIYDWRKYLGNVDFDWTVFSDDKELFSNFFSNAELEEFFGAFASKGIYIG